MSALQELLKGKKPTGTSKQTTGSSLQALLNKKPTKPALPKPTVQPVAQPIQTSTAREVGFPEDLGGGRYLTDSTGVAVKSPRSQSALPSMGLASGIERDHIVPVGLGGVSTLQNLGYKPTTAEGRQAGKVAVEQEAISKYQRGEISLYEAILLTQTKQQQILGLTPTEKEKTVKGQLPSVIKEKINPIETLKGFFKKATPTAIIKEYAKALAPKEMAEVEAKARQAEQEKLGQQSMRFETGAGMSNVEKVLPGPRVSTLEAIKKGADVQPVKAGELPTVSPVRQAQEIVRKEDVPSEIPTALGRLAGVAQTGMGAIRGTSGALSLPISLAANLASKERLPVRDVIQATSDMIEKDMASGGTASTREAAQMYLSFREIGKYGGKEPDAVDITVLALIGLGDAVGDPLLYAGAIRPALNKLKFHTQYKKVGEVTLKAKPGVKITSPQKGIVNVSDDLKIIIDPKSKSIKLSGYAKRGATGEVINQKAITGVVDDISRQTGSQLSTKVVGNDIIINTSVAPQAVVSPATKAVSLPKAEIKPQNAQGEVLYRGGTDRLTDTKNKFETGIYLTDKKTANAYNKLKDNTGLSSYKIPADAKIYKADNVEDLYKKLFKEDIYKKQSPLSKNYLSELEQYRLAEERIAKKIKSSGFDAIEYKRDIKAPKGLEDKRTVVLLSKQTTKVSAEAKPSVVEPLVEEAKKFKTADEFVKAQGTPVYHGTSADFKEFDISRSGDVTQSDWGKGIYFTDKKDVAKSFANDAVGELGGEPRIVEATLDLKNPARNKDLVDPDIQRVVDDEMGFENMGDVLRSKGFDGIEFTHTDGTKEYVVFDVNQIKTKSQLIEEWNKANKPTLPKAEVKKPVLPKKQPIKYEPIEKPPVAKGKITYQELTGKSKLAQGVETKAIEKKLTEGFADLPEYQKINIKDQAKKAKELLDYDYTKAELIALGKELPPEGVLPESVFVALENRAIKNGDVDTLRRLATESGLSNEASLMGQRIRTLAERAEDSPTTAMKQVLDQRKAYYESKHKTPLNKAIAREVDSARKAIRKTAPKKDDWLDFVNSITC